MARIEGTWPARSQVEDQATHDPFEPLKELLKMFLRGCFHWHKSRPFTVGSMTYRACTDCGARRRFDLNRWQMYGPYFFTAEPDEQRFERRSHSVPRGESNVRPMLRAA